jgi:hypothetical protein
MGATTCPASSTTVSRSPAAAKARSSTLSDTLPLASARLTVAALTPIARASSRWLRSAHRRALRSAPLTSSDSAMPRPSRLSG